MELDDLKKKVDLTGVKYSQKEIKSIFEIKTKHTLKIINRKMFIDAIAMLITASILIAITFTLGLKSRFIVSAQILGLVAVLLIHYKTKYLLLNRGYLSSRGLFDTFRKTYRTFRNYMITYLVIVPGMIIILSSLLLNLNVITGLALSIVGVIITAGLLKLIYGKEYSRLRELSKSAMLED